MRRHIWAAQYFWWPTRIVAIGHTLDTLASISVTHSPLPLQGNFIYLWSTTWHYRNLIFDFFFKSNSAEIAKHLPEDSFGLIFGLNTFFALCLQSLLTMFVVSDVFDLRLNIFRQFNVYAGYFCVLSATYLLMLFIPLCRRHPADASCNSSVDNDSTTGDMERIERV